MISLLKVDLDLGNYERFLDIKLTRDNNITTGKIYQVSDNLVYLYLFSVVIWLSLNLINWLPYLFCDSLSLTRRGGVIIWVKPFRSTILSSLCHLQVSGLARSNINLSQSGCPTCHRCHSGVDWTCSSYTRWWKRWVAWCLCYRTGWYYWRLWVDAVYRGS